MSHDQTSLITVSISSYSGEVYGMFGVIDVFNHLPKRVNTIGVGTVQSAAETILTSGTGKISLVRNTIVMIHQISNWFDGQAADISAKAKHTKDLQEMSYQTLSENHPEMLCSGGTTAKATFIFQQEYSWNTG